MNFHIYETYKLPPIGSDLSEKGLDLVKECLEDARDRVEHLADAGPAAFWSKQAKKLEKRLATELRLAAKKLAAEK